MMDQIQNMIKENNTLKLMNQKFEYGNNQF